MRQVLIQRLASLVLVSVAININFIASGQELFIQEITPTTTAFALRTAPVIDGEVLEDNAWSNVSPTGGFSQVRPDEGQPATQKTEVFVGYTEDSLYIGVVAYDDNPEEIIFTDARRDSL